MNARHGSSSILSSTWGCSSGRGQEEDGSHREPKGKCSIPEQDVCKCNVLQRPAVSFGVVENERHGLMRLIALSAANVHHFDAAVDRVALEKARSHSSPLPAPNRPLLRNTNTVRSPQRSVQQSSVAGKTGRSLAP